MAILSALKQAGKVAAKVADDAATVAKPVDDIVVAPPKPQPELPEVKQVAALSEQDTFDQFAGTGGMPPSRITDVDPSNTVPPSQIIPELQELAQPTLHGLERFNSKAQGQILRDIASPSSSSTIISIKNESLLAVSRQLGGMDDALPVDMRQFQQAFDNGDLPEPVVIDAMIDGGVLVPRNILFGGDTLKALTEMGGRGAQASTPAVVRLHDKSGRQIAVSQLDSFPSVMKTLDGETSFSAPALSSLPKTPRDNWDLDDPLLRYVHDNTDKARTPEGSRAIAKHIFGGEFNSFASTFGADDFAKQFAEEGILLPYGGGVKGVINQWKASGEVDKEKVELIQRQLQEVAAHNKVVNDDLEGDTRLWKKVIKFTENSLYTESLIGGVKSTRPMSFTRVDSNYVRDPKDKDFIQGDYPLEYTNFAIGDVSLSFREDPALINLARTNITKSADAILSEVDTDYLMEVIDGLKAGLEENLAFTKEGNRVSWTTTEDLATDIEAYLIDLEGVAFDGDSIYPALAKLVETIHKERITTVESQVHVNLQTPLLLVDLQSFRPSDIAGQLRDLEPFKKYSEMLQDILDAEHSGATAGVEAAERHASAASAIAKAVTAEGYDHIVYINQYEGKGLPSILVMNPEKHVMLTGRDSVEEAGFDTIKHGVHIASVLLLAAGLALPDEEAQASAPLSPTAKFISSWELRKSVPLLKVYDDAAKDSTGKGIPTVGYGHAFGYYNKLTKKNVIRTKEIAAYNKLSDADKQKQVEEWHRKDLRVARKSAHQFAGTRWGQLTDGQKLALTSLAFNVGNLKTQAPKAFEALKNNQLDEAAHQLFSKEDGLVNAGGNFVQGLLNRRQAELAYWNGTN